MNISLPLAAIALSLLGQLAPDPNPMVDDSEFAPNSEPLPLIEPEIHERLLVLLSAHHGLPEQAAFEAVVDEPAGTLLNIIFDGTTTDLHRDRAVAALAYWPSNLVFNTWNELLVAESTPEMMRHRILGYLALSFGDRAIPSLEPWLLTRDTQLRLTAVHAMALIDSAAARQRLELLRSTEQSPLVREALDELLAR